MSWEIFKIQNTFEKKTHMSQVLDLSILYGVDDSNIDLIEHQFHS